MNGGRRGGEGGVGHDGVITGRPTQLGPLLPELALIEGPKEAGSHALDGLACFARLGACVGAGAKRSCWRGHLAPTAGPLHPASH